jgi:PAS domain S-box-containing protein
MIFSKEFTEFHRILFDESVQPMWLYDPSTLCFVLVNDATLCLYGYTRAEMMRMSIVDIRPAEEIQNILANIETVNFEEYDTIVTERWHHKTKTNKILEIELQAQSVNYDGKLLRLVQILDVQSQDEFQSENVPEEAHYNSLAIQTPDTPIIPLSNTPITPTVGTSILDSMLMNVKDPIFVMRHITQAMQHCLQQNDMEKMRECFPLLFRAQQRLLGILTTFSMAQELHRSMKAPSMVICNARELVLSIVEEHALYAEEQGFRLDYTLPSRSFIVNTDVEYFKRILKLLLCNAFACAGKDSITEVRSSEVILPSSHHNGQMQNVLRIEIHEPDSVLNMVSARELIQYARIVKDADVYNAFIRESVYDAVSDDTKSFIATLRMNLYTACKIVQLLGGNINVHASSEVERTSLRFVVDIPANFRYFKNLPHSSSISYA